jgi:hypothetical protein
MNHILLKKALTLIGSGGSSSSQQIPPPPNISQYPSVLSPPQLSDLNTINSFSYAEIIDLLGDGPIEGLINTNNKKVYDENIFEGIYLNDTAVKETSSENLFDISILNIRNILKKHFLYSSGIIDNFLVKGSPRVKIATVNEINDKNFPKEIKITSYHPDDSILEFVKSFNGSFDSISLIQRSFDSSPIKNEYPFLTKINIPFFKASLPGSVFDFTEGGSSGDYPIKLRINNISNYIYFSITPDSLNSFNYFEIPRSFIDNNAFTVAGKKTFKKNLISQSLVSEYEIYDINIYIWSIYNTDFGIKNIDTILDKYFNKFTFFQNSKSLFNYNLIQSELKNGSEIQSPLKYFSNVEIDSEYNKELIGPYKITNNWNPKSALDAGGVQRLLNFTPVNHLIDTAVNNPLSLETSDDIRYIKSWPVSYDSRGRPYLICNALGNYSNFDKTSRSRSCQSEIPIVHYIENENVEQVYVTLNVQQLYDTNHIDLTSDNTSLGIYDNKNRTNFRQTDPAPSNINTFGSIVGYDTSADIIQGCIYFLLYGTSIENSYILDAYKTTGSFIEECLYCNVRRVVDKTQQNTLYYKTILNEKLNNLVPNLSTYIVSSPDFGYLATESNNLIKYFIPNDSCIGLENFSLYKCSAVELQSKLKILNDDGSTLYCFGLAPNDAIIPSTEKYIDLTSSSLGSKLNSTNLSKGIPNKFFHYSVKYNTFKSQFSGLIVATIVNKFIDWSLIFNKWNSSSSNILSTDLSFKDGVIFEKYPNVFKYIINPFINEIKLRKPASSSTYYTLADTLIIGNLYLIGISSGYLNSQISFFVGESANFNQRLYLKLNILDALLEQFLLSNYDSSNFSNLNYNDKISEIFDSSIISAFKQKISFFENGKLIGNSSILSIKKFPIYVNMPITEHFNSIKSNGAETVYDTNLIYLYRKDYINIPTSYYRNVINNISYSYDVIFTYSIYRNAALSNIPTLNSSVSYKHGTEIAEQQQDPSLERQENVNLRDAKQSISAGTKLPSIITIDIETGLESNEYRTYRGSCEYFSYRFNIFGLSTDSSYIDIGRKSNNSVQGFKTSSDTGKYALSLPQTIRHSGVEIYLLKLKFKDKNGIVKENFYLTDHKGFYFGDINLYQVDLSIRNHPSMSYLYGINNQLAGVKQNWYTDIQIKKDTVSGNDLSHVFDTFEEDAIAYKLTDTEISLYFNEDLDRFQLLNATNFLKNKKLISDEFYVFDSFVDSQPSKNVTANNFDTYVLYSALSKASGPSDAFITTDDVVDANNFMELKVYNYYFDVYEPTSSDVSDTKIVLPSIYSSKFYDKNLKKMRSYENLLWSPGTSAFEWMTRLHLRSFEESDLSYVGAEISTIRNFRYSLISLDGFLLINYDYKNLTPSYLPSKDPIQSTDPLAGKKIQLDANLSYINDYSASAIVPNEFNEIIKNNIGKIINSLRTRKLIGKNVVLQNIENSNVVNLSLSVIGNSNFTQTNMNFEGNRMWDDYFNSFYIKEQITPDKASVLVSLRNFKKQYKWITPSSFRPFYKKTIAQQTADVYNTEFLFKNFSTIVDTGDYRLASTIKWTSTTKDGYLSSLSTSQSYARNLNVNFFTLYDTATKRLVLYYNRTSIDRKLNWGKQLEVPIDYVPISTGPVNLSHLRSDNPSDYQPSYYVYTPARPQISYSVDKNGNLLTTQYDTRPHAYSLMNQVWLGENPEQVGIRVDGRSRVDDIPRGLASKLGIADTYRYEFNFTRNIGERIIFIAGRDRSYFHTSNIQYPEGVLTDLNLLFRHDGVISPRLYEHPATAYKTDLLKDLNSYLYYSVYSVFDNIQTTNYSDILKIVEKDFIERGSIPGDVRFLSYDAIPTSTKILSKNNLIVNYFGNVPMSNIISGITFLDSGLNIQLPKPVVDSNGNKVRRYVKITRKSHETLSPLIGKKISLNKVTEIIPQKFSYPFSSIVGTKIDSRAFSSIPVRTFHCKLKKILVPSNYFIYDENENDVRYLRGDGANQIYIGDWDGTFKLSWTNNPAWILMDLLINKRYGLGNYIESEQIDIWELYKISRWCDNVNDKGYYYGVDDGYGGKEPRHTFNAIISDKFNIFDMINQVASVFRGNVYYMNSLITFDDDRLKPVIGEFNNFDVKDGLFNYTNNKKDDEYTAVDVAYIDAKDNYKTKIEYVEDSDGIRQRGLLKKQLNVFGITSRGQAKRFGKHFLFQTSKENSNITFTTDMKALLYKPGDLIRINDEIFNSIKNFGIVKEIKPINEFSFKITIDKILDPYVYDDTEISLYVPNAKPKYEDFYSKSQFVPTGIDIQMASPMLNITYAENIKIQSNTYLKKSKLDSYTFKMIPYESNSVIKSFSGSIPIEYSLKNISTNQLSSVTLNVTGYFSYIEDINMNNEPSKYGHWQFSTGSSIYSDRLLFDIVVDEAIKYELPYRNYFFNYFDSGKYLRFTGISISNDALYEIMPFDPKSNTIKFPNSFKDGKFSFNVGEYDIPTISYYDLIESNKPSIESFYITGYDTGNLIINNEIQNEYSELYLTRSGKFEDGRYSKIKSSISDLNLNSLQSGSSYSLNIRNKKEKIFKIMSITENYINEYNIFATEYNIDKFKEIEESSSIDDMRNTFNFLNAYSNTKTYEFSPLLAAPIILSIEHLKYNSSSGIKNFIEIKWSKVQNATSFNIYIRTPSKQTNNFQLNVDITKFNFDENCFSQLIPLNDLDIEAGTYMVSIESCIGISESNSASKFRTSAVSTKSITILYY